MASQLPNTGTHSTSLRQRRLGHIMGSGSQEFRSAAGRNKMRMVRSRMGYMIDIHNISLQQVQAFP